jgi:hypothetical protein
MMSAAINIGRGFSSIAPVGEGEIAVKKHATDLVGNSTVGPLNLAIKLRCITTSSVQTELGFITNERAEQRIMS